MPTVHCLCAMYYGNFLPAYEKVLLTNRHRAVGKDSEQTNHIVLASDAKQSSLTTAAASIVVGSTDLIVLKEIR